MKNIFPLIYLSKVNDIALNWEHRGYSDVKKRDQEGEINRDRSSDFGDILVFAAEDVASSAAKIKQSDIERYTWRTTVYIRKSL